MPDLSNHLERYAEPGRHGLVFIGPKGGKIRRGNFNVIWSAACAAAGIPDAHFHDLRRTGGTLAATTGATTKEPMTRLGHSSTRAAMIYQHATRDRDKAIRKLSACSRTKPGTPRNLARGWPSAATWSAECVAKCR
jgi:integrase